ncbi:MAG TPA: hypothetical protein VLD59_01965 [Steroidobacteraceae bacterium]|nr:hypothetical protein [Steroidobacteraceae bacterium]
MRTSLRGIGAVLALLAASVAGCRSVSCSAPSGYGNDQTLPPLEIPAGLEPPDTRDSLKIPDLNEPERPRTEADGCLEEPPPYYPDRRVGEKPPST